MASLWFDVVWSGFVACLHGVFVYVVCFMRRFRVMFLRGVFTGGCHVGCFTRLSRFMAHET